MRNTLWVELLAAASSLYLVRRLGQRWGATDAEFHQALPGDDIVPHPMVETTHAITIRASAAEVWPWLVQMGSHRGGWYTYEWVEKYVWGTNLPSVDRIIPEYQHLKGGDALLDGPPGTAFFRVAAVEPPSVLALHSGTHVPNFPRINAKWSTSIDFSRVFVLREIDARTTRLILRARGSYRPRLFRMLTRPFFWPIDFLMAQGMLRRIKRQAEQTSETVHSRPRQDEPVALSTPGT